MSYEPRTPFGRKVEYYHLAADQLATPTPSVGVDKWQSLTELSASRVAHGLTDRELGTLRGLLSFHPEKLLCVSTTAPVVYPSNRALSERLNGIPLSTLRRHLAALVRAGIIIRRDSPNGKRYVRRSVGTPIAYGFDLTPLVTRFNEFCEDTRRLRAERDRIAHLREELSLMRRDLSGLAGYGSEEQPELNLWGQLSVYASRVARELRRNLTEDEMSTIRINLQNYLEDARVALGELRTTSNMVTTESQNERHHQNSDKESYESEPYLERNDSNQTLATQEDIKGYNAQPVEEHRETPLPSLPLRMVLAACKQISIFTTDPIKNWHDLFNAADRLSPAIGISESAWQDAIRILGHVEAAVVVCAILERFEEIRSPGGYLRALTNKFQSGAFSSGPMVMALFSRRKDV